ncbi:MAG TPA: PilZ domain-containing protein [Xanthobacteraceae bacterium]|nr:PilZ domain-containing protein [Xanthobacteraceae bacterium]
MDERRSVTRTRIRHNAEIVVERRSAETMQCTLHNVTNTGACLTLASTYRVPDTFELTFDHGRSRRPCRVKWRTNDQLGVSFEKPEDDVETAGVE